MFSLIDEDEHFYSLMQRLAIFFAFAEIEFICTVALSSCEDKQTLRLENYWHEQL